MVVQKAFDTQCLTYASILCSAVYKEYFSKLKPTQQQQQQQY